MADRAIGELDEALSINSTDLLVMEQDGAAKKVKGQTLENWLLKMANSHGGIQSIVLSGSSGLKDTYRITLSDGTTFDFVVTNGKSISKISKTATSGLVDTYTVSYNDNSKSTFTVTNGAKGDKGDSTFVWIRYASQKPTEASHSFGTIPDNWMGIYTGPSATAPTNWTQYSWFQIKGATGATGAAAALVSSTVEYQASEYGNVAPSGSWSSSVPNVPQGHYLWTRTTHLFNSGNPVNTYTVSRMGMDGLGSVSSVCGVSPNGDGNVPLTADLLGALPVSGGQMQGTLNMADHKLTGLRTPEADTDAAPKSFVDKSIEDKADYIKAVQGEAITLSDSAEAPMQGLKVYGKTTQNGTPTPQAPVPLESIGESVTVAVHGKNLCHIDPIDPHTKNGVTVSVKNGGIQLTGKLTDQTVSGSIHGFTKKCAVLQPGTYALSFNCVSQPQVVIKFFNLAGNVELGVSVQNATMTKHTVTINEPSSVYWGVYRNKAYAENIPSEPVFIQIEANSDATEYEPYKEPTAVTVKPVTGTGEHLYLPGIPVTSVGNYTDPVTGKQWICDEVDFEKGVYVQRIGTVTYIGSSSEGWGKSDSTEADRFYKQHSIYSKMLPVMTNMFRFVDTAQYTLDVCFLTYNASNGGYYIEVIAGEHGTFADTLAWRRYLGEHPLEVLYVLPEEKEIPLSEIDPDALAQYATLHTNYPNTTVFNDAGAGMEVKYATPNSAIPASGGNFGGQVNMCNNKLTGIPSPEDPSDAVPLSYAAQILEMGMTYTDDALKNIRSVPESVAGDNGKILTVVNGVPTWMTIETWSGGSY